MFFFIEAMHLLPHLFAWQSLSSSQGRLQE